MCKDPIKIGPIVVLLWAIYGCTKKILENNSTPIFSQRLEVKCTQGKPREEFKAPLSWQEIKRVFIIMLENVDASVAAAQPYLGELAKNGASFAGFSAVAHPSQPNYIALISGDTQGVTGDDEVNLDSQHIGDLLKGAGKRWRVYAEDYPGDCFQGMVSGNYVRKHVPFLSFKNVTGSVAECSNIVPASQLASDIDKNDLVEFSLYVPNLASDGHDTGPAYADRWLSQTFDVFLKNSAFMTGTLVIFNYDESLTDAPNQIYPVFYGAGVNPGSASSICYDHYSTLATTEQILGLSDLGKKDKTATIIDDIWK